MADTLELVLELTDRLTAPARKMAEALKAVDKQAEQAQKAADRAANKQAEMIEKVQRSLMKANAVAEKERDRRLAGEARASDRAAAAAMKANARAVAAQVREAEKATKAKERALAKETAATRVLAKAQLQAIKMNEAHDKAKKGNTFLGGFGQKLGFRSVADYAKGAFVGDLAAAAVVSIVGGFISGAKAAAGLLVDGIKGAFREGGKAENLRLSYKLLLGNKGGAALDDIGRFSGQTRYDDDKIAEMMRPLFNAGLRGTGARSAFAASGDLEAAGLGDASGFIEQFAKIQLKGGVSEKMLLSMGVSVKDFKDALAKETNSKDKEAAFAAASSGKGDPQAIMNAIYAGIEKRQGGKLGSGTEAASKTMSSRMGKLEDLPNQYLKKMSESPAWNRLSDKLGGLLEQLSPEGPHGQKVIASLFHTFDRLAEWVGKSLTPENIDGFVNGVSSLIAKLTQVPAILESIYRISRDVALIYGGVKLLQGLDAFGKAFAAASGGATIALGPILAVAAAMAAIAFAAERISATVTELGGIKAVGRDFVDFVANPMGVPAGPTGTISDADFDAKYGGAGYKLKPQGGGKQVSVEFSGDINVTPQPGESTQDAVQGAYAGSQASMQSIAERAASEGG